MHYLDHASHSWPKPATVYQALDDFAQPNSAKESSEIIQTAQQVLAELLHLPHPQHIQFMSSRAEALSLALQRIDWQYGDGILINALEHQDLLNAIMHLARTRGVQVYIVPYSQFSPCDSRDWETVLQQYPNIRLIALSHASNVIGCVFSVTAFSDLAQRYGKLFLLDASQTAGFWPLNAQRDNIDMLIFSGEKALHGPLGLSALYCSEDVRRGDDSPVKDLSLVSRIAGLTEGARWVHRYGKRQPIQALFSLLWSELDEIPEVQIYGMVEKTDQLPLLSFNVLGHHPEILSKRLFQEFGIWLRTGFHHSRFAHESIGTIHRGGTLRASLGYSSKEEDILALSQALKSILVASSNHKAWDWVTNK